MSFAQKNLVLWPLDILACPKKPFESSRNLWFHTSDIAKLDERGHFYSLDRITKRIRVKGEMVSRYEIEEAILFHPAVEDCAAIGVLSSLGDKEFKLFVVKKPD
ncbi:MAG: hypothetical protein KTR18_10340 [Acidiferrobacterales bacterium]|nr:hypothetical protein [Acidiferrobacterales bacterium]